MTFKKFADAMRKLGFAKNEEPLPFIKLDSKVLSNPIMKNRYPKPEGIYQVISMYAQKIKNNKKPHIALWIKRINVIETRIYPLYAEEVDFLIKNNRFKKEYPKPE